MNNSITNSQSSSKSAKPVERLLLSVDECQAALGVKRSTIWALLQRRELASISIGRRRLVPVAALEKFIERRLAEQDDEVPE